MKIEIDTTLEGAQSLYECIECTPNTLSAFNPDMKNPTLELSRELISIQNRIKESIITEQIDTTGTVATFLLNECTL